MLHLANSHATVLDFSPLSWMAALPWFPCILWEGRGGSRSWVSYKWCSPQMGAVLICWKVYITDVTRQTSKHTLLSPAHTWSQTRMTLASTNTRRAAGWWREYALEGRVQLRSPANVSVWPCCIFSLSSWLGQCCLPTTSNALTPFQVHIQGFFCQDGDLMKPYPGTEEESRSPLCCSTVCWLQPNCYCKYRKRFPLPVGS